MKQPIIAALLSALVWPGAGQIYNREFKKGLVLIGLTLLFGLSLVMGAGRDLLHSLPADMSAFDIEQARMLTEEIMRRNSTSLVTFNLLMTVTWVYSAFDAYLGARDRLKTDAPPADEEPPASGGPL